MADATGIGSAVAVAAALAIRLAIYTGRRNQRAGRQGTGWRDDADAEMRRAERMMARRARRAARDTRRAPAAVPPHADSRPQPSQYPGIGGRALGGVGAAMAPQAPVPVDEVTFPQLVARARWLVVDRQDASAGMVRAELGIDDDTAFRVLYELELRGVVGPATIDLLPRRVLVPRGQ